MSATPSSEGGPTEAAAWASGLPTEWARLHPLSPVVRSARVLFALAILVVPRQLTPGQHQSPLVDLISLAVALVAGVVSWLVTPWRVHGGELQIRHSVLGGCRVLLRLHAAAPRERSDR